MYLIPSYVRGSNLHNSYLGQFDRRFHALSVPLPAEVGPFIRDICFFKCNTIHTLGWILWHLPAYILCVSACVRATARAWRVLDRWQMKSFFFQLSHCGIAFVFTNFGPEVLRRSAVTQMWLWSFQLENIFFAGCSNFDLILHSVPYNFTLKDLKHGLVNTMDSHTLRFKNKWSSLEYSYVNLGNMSSRISEFTSGKLFKCVSVISVDQTAINYAWKILQIWVSLAWSALLNIHCGQLQFR